MESRVHDLFMSERCLPPPLRPPRDNGASKILTNLGRPSSRCDSPYYPSINNSCDSARRIWYFPRVFHDPQLSTRKEKGKTFNPPLFLSQGGGKETRSIFDKATRESNWAGIFNISLSRYPISVIDYYSWVRRDYCKGRKQMLDDK